ncbi:hypothetical protein A9308_03800 [Moraxella atlantae]|uniref:DNA gyrase inhibitor YacG n=1 Tax=Faucicola atlantae TaxID=34059 RepID=A0A1B8QFM2_9GAMM|nr:DNA gyrase inhibitor YacG [Moraxella atlantae]OBX80695.1 hypothetical protein A9308_03800 [Moraxella atlantae]
MNQAQNPTTATNTPATYPCPRCGTPTVWQNNANKPFCSARCKLIDLGAWASEDYKIAAQDAPFSDELMGDDQR